MRVKLRGAMDWMDLERASKTRGARSGRHWMELGPNVFSAESGLLSVRWVAEVSDSGDEPSRHGSPAGLSGVSRRMRKESKATGTN